jgi:hypothetical protein
MAIADPPCIEAAAVLFGQAGGLCLWTFCHFVFMNPFCQLSSFTVIARVARTVHMISPQTQIHTTLSLCLAQQIAPHLTYRQPRHWNCRTVDKLLSVSGFALSTNSDDFACLNVSHDLKPTQFWTQHAISRAVCALGSSRSCRDPCFADCAASRNSFLPKNARWKRRKNLHQLVLYKWLTWDIYQVNRL